MPSTQAPTPSNLEQDVTAMGRLDVVQTILEVICRTTGLGFSAVARVTDKRWIACAVRDEIDFGLRPGGELQVETTICDEIRDSGQLVAIDHVAEDEAFCGHPTPKMYGFESYISVPIRLKDGRFFGTLCGIDPRPRRVNNRETIAMFELFANLIALHYDGQRQLLVSETALFDERQRTNLQDQFVAVLGHDLRNPLSAIQVGARTLLAMPNTDKVVSIARVIDRSASRMTRLIEDVLDFARGRLGGGIAMNLLPDPGLQAMLEQVVAEMRTGQPGRLIDTEMAITEDVVCDRARVGQLLSNLLGNALSHGDPAGPVRVRAHTRDGGFELSVANQGRPIPPDVLERLFQPFARAALPADRDGLGLGLYIASEIARAHQGSLRVESSPEETRFTFRMPVRPA
jgi:signal transduction histidine kinase